MLMEERDQGIAVDCKRDRFVLTEPVHISEPAWREMKSSTSFLLLGTERLHRFHTTTDKPPVEDREILALHAFYATR